MATIYGAAGSGGTIYGGTGGGSSSGPSRKHNASWWDHLGANAIHAAEDFGVGLGVGTLQLGKALGEAAAGHPGALGQLAVLEGKALYTDVRHPLRNPINTALDASMFLTGGASIGLRTAEALRVARALETGGDVAEIGTPGRAFLRSPAKHTREITVSGPEGGTVVRGKYRRGSLSHLFGQTGDIQLERAGARATAARAAGAEVRPIDLKLEGRLQKRVEKWNRKAAKVEEDRLRAKGLKVVALGRKYNLDHGQQRALRIVAETVPYNDVLHAAEDRHAEALDLQARANAAYDTAKNTNEKRQARRMIRASNAAVAGHQDRVEWIKDARQYIDDGADGRPVLKPEEEGLQHVYNAMGDAVGEREALLMGLGIMDEAGFKEARDRTAKLASGGYYVHDADARRAAQQAAADGRAAEHNVRRAAQTQVREQIGAMRESGQKLGSVESRFFREQTTRSQAEKDARRLVDKANREMQQGLAMKERGRARGGSRAQLAADIRARLERENELGRITWERYQRGEVGPGVLDRSQRRIGRLNDLYDKHAPALQARREGERLAAEGGAQQIAGATAMEQHAATLAEIEAATQERITQLEADVKSARQLHRSNKYRLDQARELRDLRIQHARQLTEAKIAAELARAGKVVGSDASAAEHAIHIGDERAQGRRAAQAIRASSSKTLGHTRSTSIRTKTGRARELGAETNDTTDLVMRRHAEAVRLTRLSRVIQRVASMGSKIPQRKDDVFVWTDRLLSSERIDPSVKDFLADPDTYLNLSEEERKSFGQKLRDSLVEAPGAGERGVNWKSENPTVQQRRLELEQAAEEGKGVFVPRRLLGDAAKTMPHVFPGPARKFFDTVNNIEKTLLIYAKPSYPLIQGLSNVGLNIIHQGVFAPRNLAWAIGLNKAVGRESASLIDHVMGQGFVHQAAFEGSGAVAQQSHRLATFFGKISDVAPRRAAWLHEARKEGFTTPEEIDKLLKDPKYADDLNTITQKAKEAIVDFDNLSANEKAYARSLLFVYPWVKGSTVYLSHFLQDHPVQAAILGQAGETGARVNQAAFGDRPTYSENWVPTPWGRIDLQSMNPFATPAELGRSVASLVTGSAKAQTGASYLSPLPASILALATRRDESGYPLTGGLAQNLRQLFVSNTPVARLVQGLVARGDYAGAGNAVRILFGTQRESKTYPGNLAALGAFDPLASYGLGGLYPRGVSQAGLASAAARQGQR